jgi:transposase-like protein
MARLAGGGPLARGVDRRNGSFPRHLVTELGDIELHIPRTRRFSPLSVVRAYARRARRVDQLIMACFVLGVSTRKVAAALLPVLGEPVSTTTVSWMAQSLDKAVASFNRRPITRRYRFLILDGVVLKRKTGAGSVKRVGLPFSSWSGANVLVVIHLCHRNFIAGNSILRLDAA